MALGLAWLAIACQAQAPSGTGEMPAEPPATAPAASGAPAAGADDATPEPSEGGTDPGDTQPDTTIDPERAHTVVFADRTSQGYLLMVSPDRLAKAPTREQIDAWIATRYGDRADEGEVALMRKLAATAPHDTDLKTSDITEVKAGEVLLRDGLSNRDDLIGLHIELLPRSADLLDPAALADPVATRALNPAQRESIADRTQILLLRGDYRNLNDVRGLRLLQSIVALIAERHDALIFDPDTLETMGAATFAQRQLTANASNVVDQLAIVPFADPKHPASVRLATRGMRRFGAPDIELDALPRDPAVLQRASDLLAGLARVMVDAARVDASGLAVSADDLIEVQRRDIDRAYANASERLPPRCTDCPERVVVHLVRRPALDTDAREHLTVRVVAPRQLSDQADHDHASWVSGTLRSMFGAPAKP